MVCLPSILTVADTWRILGKLRYFIRQTNLIDCFSFQGLPIPKSLRKFIDNILCNSVYKIAQNSIGLVSPVKSTRP